ncbi:MAG: hypothetical protein KGL67_02945 [Patescibacteria group bacterium]|nr:hypothetical protein [Patescibacteria group bacterium]
MKKILTIIIALGVIVGIFYFVNKKSAVAPVATPTTPTEVQNAELCYAYFSSTNERGFSDLYTLHMLMSGEKVTGELKFLPGEKDSKVGKFEGTVGGVNKTTMLQTADIWWDTFGEGITAKEQLKFTFDKNTASLGAGELIDRGDGVYVYKDPENLFYNIHLTALPCSSLVLRDNVENYLRANISKLSPVKAVLGGTWHVIGVTVDLGKSAGVVVYEDGHIQEKKNFSYTTNEKQEIISLTITK